MNADKMDAKSEQCFDALHSDENYNDLKTHFGALLNNCDRSTTHILLRQDIDVYGLSRRKALALMSELIDLIPFDKESDDMLHDDLSNIISEILGECTPDGIRRFKGDPENGEILTDYVRSWEWTAYDWYNK